MPDVHDFVSSCVLATPSDVEAHADFHQTLRRQQSSGQFDGS
ncbi:MAG: hypothetical protein ACRYGP_16240 [Janthinobacterium lividum]